MQNFPRNRIHLGMIVHLDNSHLQCNCKHIQNLGSEHCPLFSSLYLRYKAKCIFMSVKCLQKSGVEVKSYTTVANAKTLLLIQWQQAWALNRK